MVFWVVPSHLLEVYVLTFILFKGMGFWFPKEPKLLRLNHFPFTFQKDTYNIVALKQCFTSIPHVLWTVPMVIFMSVFNDLRVTPTTESHFILSISNQLLDTLLFYAFGFSLGWNLLKLPMFVIVMVCVIDRNGN